MLLTETEKGLNQESERYLDTNRTPAFFPYVVLRDEISCDTTVVHVTLRGQIELEKSKYSVVL